MKYFDVVFIGLKFGDEFVCYFVDVDVFVFLSWIDIFGLVNLEVMVCGILVVVFFVYGFKDIILGLGGGFINEDLC